MVGNVFAAPGGPVGTELVCDEAHTILVGGGLGSRRCMASTVAVMSQTLSRGPVSGTAVKPNAAKRKPFLLDLYGTAVGKKYVMAITGLIGIGFVLTHMIGNLKMYLGVITEGDEEARAACDHVIEIPSCPQYSSVVPAAVALQLLSYHIARIRGCAIDQPRNLAKSVTVE